LLAKLDLFSQAYDAIVCRVAFGNKGLFKPFKSKYGLVFRNWCQQGVLYNREVFSFFTFDETYPIQADHKFNIEISSKSMSRILYEDIIVSYFNTSGISQSVHDTSFRRDMPAIVSANLGPIWGGVSVLRRMFGSLRRTYLS
jgi:hypothetical protein